MELQIFLIYFLSSFPLLVLFVSVLSPGSENKHMLRKKKKMKQRTKSPRWDPPVFASEEEMENLPKDLCFLKIQLCIACFSTAWGYEET